jgi:ABC-type multidrug transport system fused ATPase/permease subunit
LHEIFSHIHLIKAFDKEGHHAEQHVKGLTENMRMNLGVARLEAATSFSNDLIGRLIMGAVILYGGLRAVKGDITLGSLSAIALYLGQLSGVMRALSQSSQQLVFGIVSWERLEKILDYRAEPPIRRETAAFFSNGRIEFRNVAFGYKTTRPTEIGGRQPIFDGLNLVIDGNSCVGIVGPSGCGKTTLVNLILGLHRPLRGDIVIDGRDISGLEKTSFCSQFGVALQEPYLWDDTVENNIRYGKAAAAFGEVEAAARMACAHEFIRGLKKGYETVIGENACRISEGQKQRIAVARAVIRRPKILILDEALSSVDSETADRIITNIKNTLKETTIIIISHHISVISKMDTVYFLRGPNRIDADQHERLLERSAEYRVYLAAHLDPQVA